MGSNTVELPFSMQLLSGLVKTANALIRRDDYTIRRWLGDIEEIRLPACSAPIFGVSTKDFPAATGHPDEDESWVRIFVPLRSLKKSAASPTIPVVVYYHGGGFAVLRPDFILYDIFCRRLAKVADCIVVSVNYPRSPEHSCPSVHASSFRLLKWLKSTYKDHLPPFADVTRCFLSGDSAGGNLALYVACRAAVEGESLEPVRVRGNILIQPFFGGEERTESEIMLQDGPIINLEMTDWYWKAYLPEGEDRDHPICNVFGPRAESLSNIPLPPSLVIVGEYDLLKDWQLTYAQGLLQAGKKVKVLFYKKAVHVFHIFYRLDVSEQLLIDIAEFMKNVSSWSSSSSYEL